MDANPTMVIVPNQVEGWISGVFQVEIAADHMVKLVYEDRSELYVRLEFLPHAVQSNFFALVRCVQNASRANGQKLDSARIS